jgi:hypothetical protein
MSSPTVPTPEETLNALSDLHPEIFRAFEHGVFKAKSYFESEALEWDASAFSTIVRLHAKAYLCAKGLDAVEVERVNLCGLSLRVPGHYIKMWKADGSELPVPGTSEPKQEFYQQPLFPPDADHASPLRLAVLWNVDWQKNLSAAWLVCPKYGDERSAEAHWCVRIPDPALSLERRGTSPIPPTDLPIQRKLEITGTKDN